MIVLSDWKLSRKFLYWKVFTLLIFTKNFVDQILKKIFFNNFFFLNFFDQEFSGPIFTKNIFLKTPFDQFFINQNNSFDFDKIQTKSLLLGVGFFTTIVWCLESSGSIQFNSMILAYFPPFILKPKQPN